MPPLVPPALRDAIARTDAAAEIALDHVRSDAADRLFYSLSSACDHGILWHVVGAGRAARHGDLADAARFSAAMGIESFVTNIVVKSIFGRRRPPRDDAPLPYGVRVPITSSFPSGHATAAFTAAVLLSRDGRGSLRWFALAGLVGVSRVYVRLHHASDVAAGAALGLALGAALRPMVPPLRGMRGVRVAVAREHRSRRHP